MSSERSKQGKRLICLRDLYVKFIKKKQDELISLPNGNDITLKPIETYEMPIRLSAKEEGALINHLEVIVEDGKIM